MVSGSPRRLCAHFWRYRVPTTEGVSVTTSSYLPAFTQPGYAHLHLRTEGHSSGILCPQAKGLCGRRLRAFGKVLRCPLNCEGRYTARRRPWSFRSHFNRCAIP
jgi:hypothetical protein